MATKESQSDIFRKAARDLECDESEERFTEAMRKIGKAKPLSDDEVKKAAKKTRDKER